MSGAFLNHSKDESEHAADSGDFLAVAVPHRRERVVVTEEFVGSIDQMKLKLPASRFCMNRSVGDPSATSNNSNGGQITSPRFFQSNTPDARFFQFSLKYLF